VVHWVDRLTAPLAPRWTMQRQRARIAAELLLRHYEGAAVGRRTDGWYRATGTDANAAAGPGLARLREQARDLERNNPWAVSALDTIVDHAVGWGISAAPDKTSRSEVRAESIWKQWAETPACDADGQRNFYGLQKLAMRTTARDGEVLIRRRIRRPEDGLPLPVQLQVLEADFLDTAKEGTGTHGGGIVQGVEFDAIGRRTNYWLFKDHPGSQGVTARGTFNVTSVPVPASEILHIYDAKRPGQVRGVSWAAPVLLRMKDFDVFEDAALMKQQIAACTAVFTTDTDGTSPPMGGTDPTSPEIDRLEPGMIHNLPIGRDVKFVDPPMVNEHAAYCATILRAVAAGWGVTYEDLTGDYANMPFSAARMSRLRHWARVEDWRWQMLIPQFCDPVWAWAMQAALIMGKVNEIPAAVWTAQPAPMIDPSAEGLAYQRAIRSGIMSLSEAIKERGYDPDSLLAEIDADNKKLDKLGIILDSDARQTTQQGGPRNPLQRTVTSPAPAAQPAGTNGNGNASRNGHHVDPLALLAQVRALSDQIADVVAERMVAERRVDPAPATPPVTVEVSAPAPPPAQSIHVDVHTAEPERTTIKKRTPIRDKDGVILHVLEEAVPAEPAPDPDPVGQGF